ncbi:murein DD-endopeptidase MepM/ murein hydrolase activator NlpD [Kitasatospora sp. MAA4]|uniref:M23 family metallopeptidase n=1 Tax=Kitasatospora sp. MAA4 TaxID=3035093 RepID=UPI0024767EFC|nr:M23 family metallopeptidase [Kitasatospora sp. MAA4]MDH6136305.1 murein DD-endopeptidase MepM/ murein hydrolase activator NlpD [Kitasatospora sp. MAA4]
MALSQSQQSPTRLLDHSTDPAATTAPDAAARHRIPKQSRSGGPVLGVTAMAAALGATGLSAATAAAAAAPPAPAPSVSAPDGASDAVHQDAALSSLASHTSTAADPGLALAARIQQQADSRRTAAEESARLEAAQEAAAKRAAQAEAAAHEAAAQEAAARAAAEAAAAQAAAEATAQAAAQPVEPSVQQPPVQGEFTLPTSKYTLTAQYGQSTSHWGHLHAGLDFAAPTGTPVTAVGAGAVTSAGWSGAYGYRVIQTLPDGTEVWYCHLSSIAVASGPVATSTVLGKVGATGNAPALLPGGAPSGPHLHLEIRPGGAAPVDPQPWLQQRGVTA